MVTMRSERGLLVPLSLSGLGQGFVDDADGDFDSGGDGADGFSALAAGQDRGAFVVVDHGSAAADPAATARRTARCSANVVTPAAESAEVMRRRESTR